MAQAGLNAVLAEHQSLMRAWFSRRCAEPEDVEDLVQEAVCAVINGWPRFAGRSAVSTWILAICRHVYADHVAAAQRRRRIERTVADCQVAAENQTGPGQCGDLAMVVDSLPPAARVLYGLFYVQGFTIRQIAALQACPEGTVKYRLNRLRASLREQLLGN
jgi:RNA polymerase sigma-70 factor (ECF subfamily)